MTCENENATYGSLHDAFSAFKRTDGAQASASDAGKTSAPAPDTVHGSLSAAIAASGSLASELVAADGVQTAARIPAVSAATASSPQSSSIGSFAVRASPFSVFARQQSASPVSQQVTSPAGSAASMPNAPQKQVSSGRVHAIVTIVPCSRRA